MRRWHDGRLSRIVFGQAFLLTPLVPDSADKPEILIRDLDSIADLQLAIDLEKLTWEAADSDVIPLALAIATRAAGAMWIGAFDKAQLVGFAFAIPSLEHGRTAFHSHMLGVRPSYRGSSIGYRLKLAQRQRALALGIREITWTFDPLRSRNAHLNFCRLGVISNDYRADFYGPQTSSPLHRNGTDRLWVTWHVADQRVESRLRGKDVRLENLDTLIHLEPLISFNGDGRPAMSDLAQALARQRVAIEIPGDMDRIEAEDESLAREWRLATRSAFTESLGAGFVVKEFVRSIRGQQGPGAYLLEKTES
jgi:predicted GNAT superfamily acetyltransferase